METIKNAIGFGSKPEEGKEPVNGETGAGTATEPYDAGNQEEMSPGSTTATETATSDKVAPLPGTSTTESGASAPTADTKSKTDSVLPPSSAAHTDTTPAAKGLSEPLKLTGPKEEVPSTSEPATTTSAGEGIVPETKNETPAGGDATKAVAPGAAIAAAAAVSDSSEPVMKEDKSTAPIVDETAPVASEPAPAAKEIAPVAAATAPSSSKIAEPTKKESSIGSTGWFKDTFTRQKSKIPATADSEKAVSPEADKKKEVVAAPLPMPAKEEPVQPKSAATPRPTPAPAPVAATKEDPSAEPKKTKGRSASRDLGKLFKSNPFKKRESKAGIEEEPKQVEKSQEKSRAVPAVAAASATGAAVGAGVAEEEKPAAVKEESTAPNHLASDVPAGAAEPAAPEDLPPLQDAKTLEKPSSVEPTTTATEATEPGVTATAAPEPVEHTSTAALDGIAPDKVHSDAAADDDIAPDQVVSGSSKVTADDDIAPDQVVSGSSKVTADDDIAPDQVASEPSQPVEDSTAATSAPPMIKEPETEAPLQQNKNIRGPNPANENLSAIPTAGGLKLGQKAMEERRLSQDRRKSLAPSAVESKPAVAEASKPSATSANKDLPATPNASTEKKEHSGGVTRRASVFDKLKSKIKI